MVSGSDSVCPSQNVTITIPGCADDNGGQYFVVPKTYGTPIDMCWRIGWLAVGGGGETDGDGSPFGHENPYCCSPLIKFLIGTFGGPGAHCPV